MMDKIFPFFSIVMPAYGVEKYIEKAIVSIVEQTFVEWELIVVNDCSPDKSVQIAETYSEKDTRIKLVNHKENQGLSAARNTGMERAKGNYIWFLDSDDYVEADLLESVYNSLQKNQAELVVFGLIEEYFDKKGVLNYTHKIQPEHKLYSEQQDLRKAIIYLEKQTLYGYAWNKIYKLEYLKNLNLKYENITLIEDIVFNIKYCMDIEKMNVLSIVPYHYAKRLDTNLTNKFVSDYFKLHKQRVEMIFEQYSYWNLCSSEFREILGSLYGRYILSALQRNCDRRSGMTHSQRRKWCENLFNQRLYNEVIPYARASESKSLRMGLFFLRRKKAVMCLAMGRGIFIAREKMPMFYSKSKSKR